MFSEELHAFCSEFYVVEKSIEVVVNIGGERRRIRIDALHDERDGHYSTISYVKEDVILQPTYPQTHGSFGRTPEDMHVWVSFDLPWTHLDTADHALRQALGFLRERCSS